MKKIISWFLRNVSILNSFLLINVIALLIIDFGIHLETASIEILLAIAAITSTFFLYLAFKESKKANDYNISQPLFTEFENHIEEQKSKAHENLFSEFTVNYLNRYIKKGLIEINETTYSNFTYPISKIYSEIIKTTLYNQYMSRLDYAESVSLLPDNRDLEDVQRFVIIFNDIHIGILHLLFNYNMILNMYNSINQSTLFKIQKEILFARLDVLCFEYDLISEAIKNDKPDYKQLINFKTFEIKEDNLVVRSSIEFSEHFMDTYKNIQQVKVKRENKQIDRKKHQLTRSV
jgi:hypothetical protein